MNRDDVIHQLHAVAPILLSEYGITQVSLFGSYAKNEATSESDIDILIMNMNRKNGFTIARAQRFLSEYFNKKVDLGLYDSLRPFIKTAIQNEIVNVKESGRTFPV